MKPFDPRLLRYARAARGVLLVGAGLGAARTLAILLWSWCLAQSLAVVLLPVLGNDGAASGEGPTGRVAEGAAPAAALPLILAAAAAAVVVRSAASWGMDAVAARGAIRVKSELRGAALDALDSRSPVRTDGRSDARLTTMLGRGLDALDGYFSGYVPQLILTAVATPVLVLAVLLADPTSAVVVLVVFPVIPIFMVLIGLATQAVQDRQWQQLQRLSSSFLDVVAGLPTLKIFGRERRQRERMAREADEYRSRTMRVLRVTFLSGFVMDLAGTFSIALVAVTVGTRVVVGEFPLALGLFVLLLLPEVFIPIRQVGAAFHASAEGLAAADEVFALIEGDPATGGASSDAPRERGDASVILRERSDSRDPDPVIVLTDVRVALGGREVVGPVSFEVRRGEVVALAGPSGAGKSTLLATLLGFVTPCSGTVAGPDTVAWVGQRAGLLQGTVAENVALGTRSDGADGIDGSRVSAALSDAGLPGFAHDLALGAGGGGVSGGQAQRIAIARALYRARELGAPALLLDEPTSALDAAHEAVVCGALRREADAGRAVLVVSHREAVLGAADRVVRIGAEVPA
ncbi:thiol reductant ABC exporter subunit CydD [Leucobacter zeae]|nr:thiol reductant ABC exporter subunit CydD [Leucobacter zeae]